jgi:outer membrane protein assembly factor BamE (lipoprotein component of BamABCDE complex)
VKQRIILHAVLAGLATCLQSCAVRPEKVEYIQLHPGMTQSDVRAALGDRHDIDGYGAGYCDWEYTERKLIVSFDAQGNLIAVSVPKHP